MAVNWLEVAQKMGEAARAGVAIERKRLQEILAERARQQSAQGTQTNARRSRHALRALPALTAVASLRSRAALVSCTTFPSRPGHDWQSAPADHPGNIGRRYLRSFQNLARAFTRADHAILFDNSTEEGYRLVALLEASEGQWFPPIPAWAARLRAMTLRG